MPTTHNPPSPAEAEKEAIARFGQITSRTQHELRFGKNRKIAVVLTGEKAGHFYDHSEGKGGRLGGKEQRWKFGRLGKPAATYHYTSRDSEPCGVARWDRGNGKKDFRPFWFNDSGALGGFKDPESGFLLYGQERLEATPDALVLICEGEKSADAAMFGPVNDELGLLGVNAIGISWAHGANAAGKADFSPLKGRQCVLLPDNDTQGFRAMDVVAAKLREAGAASVGLCKPPPGTKKGWDIADAPPPGCTQPMIADAIIKARDENYEPPPGDGVGEELAPPWANELQCAKSGAPLANDFNVTTILTLDPGTAGAIAFDQFRSQYMLMRPVPWGLSDDKFPRQWTDIDDTGCAIWLQSQGVQVNPKAIPAAMMRVAHHKRFNPLQDHLRSLHWDETKRVDDWLIKYFGAEDTLANREFGRCFLIAAVARAMQPGCKADSMLVLEGVQAKKKSMALRALAGPEYFTDELHDIGSKDSAMQMAGVWIIENSELDGLSRAEVTRIKAWLSRTTDRFRPPYGRAVVEQPRSSVIVGSTNRDDYLRDETGNRRFWPVRIEHIDLPKLKAARDQLWAEAFKRWKDGEIWWIADDKLVKAAEDAQAKRLHSHPWRDEILGYIEPMNEFTIADIFDHVLRIDLKDRSRSDEMAIAEILRAAGWMRSVTTKNNRSVRVYRSPNYNLFSETYDRTTTGRS